MRVTTYLQSHSVVLIGSGLYTQLLILSGRGHRQTSHRWDINQDHSRRMQLQPCLQLSLCLFRGSVDDPFNDLGNLFQSALSATYPFFGSSHTLQHQQRGLFKTFQLRTAPAQQPTQHKVTRRNIEDFTYRKPKPIVAQRQHLSPPIQAPRDSCRVPPPRETRRGGEKSEANPARDCGVEIGFPEAGK
jgi:hypothetical protein